MTSAEQTLTLSSPTELAVSGLNCNNCARKVTGIVQSHGSVASVAVDVERQRATIRWKPEVPGELATILQALDRAGYRSRVVEREADGSGSMMGSWTLNLSVGIPVTALLMLGEWVFRLGEVRWFAWTAFGLAGVVQVLAGAKFYRGAWSQLRAGSSNMDTLVSLGSTTAFGYSTWALFAGWPGHLYFMEAAAILTLISLGHWIEARVGEKAAGSLKALMQLAPQVARRFDPETGAEHEVSVAELRSGDRVALRPGDRVPVDGEVIDGDSAVDESMLTGESKPVDKQPNSTLYAGTTNLNGRLVMRVTATGESTALAQIIAAVQRAQTSRANIQRLGDQVSNVFVPIVCALALGTALWWGFGHDSALRAHAFLAQWLWPSHPAETALAAAFIGAAAVLIVACPCAMGLATPAAIMAAANTAARRGILIRDGVALEKAGRVTAVLFDKTGTLTVGKPSVAKTRFLDGDPGGEGARLASALARNSTHPISQAIAQGGAGTVELQGWREVRGAGVEARTGLVGEGTMVVRLGSLRWLGEAGVSLGGADPFVAEWSGKGASVVGLSAGSDLLGLFAVQDALKPGASEVVRQLSAGGMRIFLITGDNPRTAASIAQEAGVPEANVFADVRPEEKADLVKRLQAAGEKVAFVGDGINDAPALEQADLGIAVSRASDVAREAADIILIKSDIEAVPESIGLARASLRTIKQNLFWAFFYNVAAIPLAVLGFMSPVLCAAAMGLSDIVVIGNALRLRRWRAAAPSRPS